MNKEFLKTSFLIFLTLAILVGLLLLLAYGTEPREKNYIEPITDEELEIIEFGE